MSKKPLVVDFIGIGAPRAGSTWISRCLAEHPDICFSSVKETHFFDKKFNLDRGLNYYQSFFKKCQKKIKGEFTPCYYLDEKIAKRIGGLFPDVKILVCLRNPVERAFSSYLLRKRRFGDKPNPDFISVLNKKDRCLNDGFYYHYLSKFIKYFPSNNILILIYEDSLQNPFLFIQNIYQFLNVDKDFIPPSIHQKLNASNDIKYRFYFLNRILRKRNKIKRYKIGRALISCLKFLGFNNLIKLLLKYTISKKILKLKEKIDRSARQKLIDLYKSDIKKLENLINRDLSFWQ